MFVKQFYTGCLSEAAYYIESNGIAAVIDPMRDIDEYLQLAKQRNATIQYIFETHFHADFISGHLELAKATNATIVYGPNTSTKFAVHVAKDNEVFTIGNITMQVLHTPGHTLESSCYLLKNEDGKDYAVFTGDTLFVGDVGRPDLAQKSNEITMQDLAGMLYNSLQTKIMPLADDVIVYPAHGAGSSCGKNLGPETYSTIGQQKQSNYALQQTSIDDFIKAVTDGLAAPPQYFPINAKINKEGYEHLEKIIELGMKPLSITEFKTLQQNDDYIILDTRPATEFTEGFIPTSISIGLEGRFAEWAGSILPFDKTFLLVTPPTKEQETIIRLSRVGFEKFAGHLNGGFASWQNANEPIDMIVNVEADELAMDIPFDEKLLIVDVRKEAEYNNEHLKDATNIPLNEMTDTASIANLDDEINNIYLHCQGGYRSVIAASLIKRQGLHNIKNVVGGWNAFVKDAELKQKFKFEKTVEALN